MPPDGNLSFYIFILFILIVLNAFFAMSEAAVVALNDSKVRKQAQDGNRKATLLTRMMDEPSRFLSTTQLGVSLSGLLAAAVAASILAPYLAAVIQLTALSPAARHAVAIIATTLILSYFILVLGELVPKRIATHHGEKIAFSIVYPLHLFYMTARPVVAILSGSAAAILRLFGISSGSQMEEVTEEEIRMLIDVGNETGHIEESDKDMINNIFEFDDRTADEMMTHRTEIVALEQDASLDEVIRTATESGYSRIPVYEDDLDSILGILYVKDLLNLVLASDCTDFSLAAHLREPMYVHESTNCKFLMRDFKAKKLHMAIVADEYGGTSGLITMEDLLESIVGNIQDEYDDEGDDEDGITVLSENNYLIDGLTELDGVEKYFGLELDNDDDYDTIGGYIVSLLGYIPDDGEFPCITVGDVCFTVYEMDERRIAKLRAERISPADAMLIQESI